MDPLQSPSWWKKFIKKNSISLLPTTKFSTIYFWYLIIHGGLCHEFYYSKNKNSPLKFDWKKRRKFQCILLNLQRNVRSFQKIMISQIKNCIYFMQKKVTIFFKKLMNYIVHHKQLKIIFLISSIYYLEWLLWPSRKI